MMAGNTDTKYTSLGLGDFLKSYGLEVEERGMEVLRSAINETVETAQVPVAKGGRMRIDTGYLRKSGTAQLNSLPSGPGRGDPKAPKGFYDNGGGDITGLSAALAQMKSGDTLYFGWVAEYALARETTDMFMENAVQRWQQFVKAAADRMVAKRGGK
jgi:hypothetical protein